MLNIRKFQPTEEEYKAINRVYNLAWPEFKLTVAEMKNQDVKRSPEYYFQRYAAEVNGEIVGCGDCFQMFEAFHPRKFHMDIKVDPAHGRKGIGSGLLEFIIDSLAEKNPVAIGAATIDDMEPSVNFLDKHGFEIIMRNPRSILNVADFDEAEYRDVLAKVAASGIRIVSLTQLKEMDKDWMRNVHELEWEVGLDVPSTDPPKKRSLEEFEREDLGSLNFQPDCYYVALDGMKYVGMSTLWSRQAEKDKLETGLTGVTRSHRRRGIATALKVHAIEAGRKQGAKEIETDNEENNPMYDLNMVLGYKPAPAVLIYEKKLIDEKEGR